MTQKYLILDYETFSEADLKAVGAHEYAVHPSTRIICAAWRVGTKDQLRKVPIKTWLPGADDNYLELAKMLRDPSIKVVAHNAFFEQVITEHVLHPYLSLFPYFSTPPERWVCTAAMAASFALPRNLEGACEALDLPVKKDMEGRRLILKYCKPRKPTKNNPAKFHNDPKDIKRIVEYCATDIKAETELFLRLPELNETERKVWLLDQKMNLRGFRADRNLIDNALTMIEDETRALHLETKTLSEGDIKRATERDKVLKWLNAQGLSLPDLRAKTVSDALSSGLAQGDAARMLEIRQNVSKTSTKKYKAFEARSRFDGRCRDIIFYHGASTGRFTGKGLQPHNLPRPELKQKDIEYIIKILSENHA